LLDELGKGAFGLVSKGILKESAAVPGYLVAVKSLLPTSASSDRKELLEESAVMAQFAHPNVTQLIGVCTVGKQLLVVLEYCENGSLKYYLEKHPEIDEATRLLFALDCCNGLAHVHQKGFVHRDVAARNALISSERRAKIADFGLSRETDDNSAYYKSKGGQLPVRWTAPEALEDRKFGEKSDVWGFGVLVHEIYTQAALPYKGLNNQRVWIDVLAGYRIPCAPGCPDKVYQLMTRCNSLYPVTVVKQPNHTCYPALVLLHSFLPLTYIMLPPFLPAPARGTPSPTPSHPLLHMAVIRCWMADPKERPTFQEMSKFWGQQYTAVSGNPLPEGEVSTSVKEGDSHQGRRETKYVRFCIGCTGCRQLPSACGWPLLLR